MRVRQGFSLVELIVVIAIASLLIVATTVLIGRFFTLSRWQFEQARTTEDARIQSERLTDTIRNARHIECNIIPGPDQLVEWWLQTAESARAVLYSNIDTDPATERITYQLTGTTLTRRVDQDTTTACNFTAGTPQVVAHSLRNVATQPLFEYIGADGETLSGSFIPTHVMRVRLRLVVDADGQDIENAATILTEITPRLGQQMALAPTTTPPPATPTASPTPTAGPAPRSIIFVTEKLIDANLNTTDFRNATFHNANTLCRTEAAAGGFKQWLFFTPIISNTTNSFKAWRKLPPGPITLADKKTLVAMDPDEMWRDQSIKAPIDILANGRSIYLSSNNTQVTLTEEDRKVWTGTNSSGELFSPPALGSSSPFCNDWTPIAASGGSPAGVELGRIGSTNGDWISWYGTDEKYKTSPPASCNTSHRLYCIGPADGTQPF